MNPPTVCPVEECPGMVLHVDLFEHLDLSHSGREVAATLAGVAIAATTHQPRRGDEVEAWLKAERDEYAHGGLTWSAISNLIDAYRMAADAGKPLGRDVSDGGQA